ncbi:uncharacterized protein LOC116842330 isoform X2 [Odontomachus brunneus]|nr:uncharacterized protein LOC116842330 isoform X2 [Odontomachus brunneus]
MPEIMAEAFARGLVDKIMVEVLNVIDRDTQNGKSWEQRVDEETNDGQSELVHERSQEHACKLTNCAKTEEMELIAQIVRDLRDIQIGDSCYVLPPSLLALGKQVKYPTCNIDDALRASPADVVETRASQGQGDTHQVVHTAVLESASEQTESAGTVRKKKENETIREAANVSVGLLHQLIEELENKSVSVESSKNVIASSTSVGKEHLVTWEEKEEQLIRTIERPDNPLETTDILRASESASCFRDVELKPHEGEPDGELRSRSSQHVASTSRESCPQIERYDSSPLSPSKSRRDNVAMMEEIIEDVETRKASGEATLTATAKKMKKKGLGGRLRRFFRTAFGRKN